MSHDPFTHRERAWAWAIGLGVMVVWGLSFVATRMAVATIPPLTLAFLRFFIALLILAPWIRHGLRGLEPSRSDKRDLLLAGLLGITLAFILENVGLEHTTATHGSILVATTPIATALTEAALDRRRPRVTMLLGLALAFAGVVLLVTHGEDGEASFLGDVLILLSVAVWVGYGFVVNRLAKRYRIRTITGIAVFWGVVTLFPLALGELLWRGVPDVTVEGVGALLFLGIVCSAIAYMGWNRALKVLGVTRTNSLIYGIPLVAVTFGVWWLDEPFGTSVLLGGGLVIAGLVLANLERPSSRPPPSPPAAA